MLQNSVDIREPLRLVDCRWRQENSVNDAEDRDIGGNTERKRKEHDRCESRLLPKLSDSKMQIHQQRVQPPEKIHMRAPRLPLDTSLQPYTQNRCRGAPQFISASTSMSLNDGTSNTANDGHRRRFQKSKGSMGLCAPTNSEITVP